MRRRVALLACGGTIAGVPDPAGHAAPRRGATDIVAAAGRLDDVDVTARDVLRTSSRAVTPADMLAVAVAVRDAFADGVDGVVVTHGTDTLEETAYFLALTVPADRPVVVTGAMRHAGHPAPDGGGNVRAAICLAASDDAAGRGPLAVLADEVHAARWVTKAHTSRPAALASPETGPLGVVAEDRPVLAPLVAADPPLGLPEQIGGRVELLCAYAGADGLLADAVAGQVDGLVVAGTGGGHVPPPMAAALARYARDGLPIVLASRCAAGPTLRGTYSGPGSETDLLAAGLLPAGRLPAAKCRLRLLVALALGLDPSTVFPLE